MNMRESPRENAARHASSESRREEEILNAPIIAITARNHPIGDLCEEWARDAVLSTNPPISDDVGKYWITLGSAPAAQLMVASGN